MFPKEIITTCTIYIFHRDFVTANVTMHRAELHGIFWNENSISVFVQTGQQVPTGVDIFVPGDPDITGRKYIPPIEWYEQPETDLDEFWTVDLQQANFTRIVRGTPPFVFPIGTQQILTQQLANVSNPNHVDFIPGLRVIRDVNNQMYGLSEMGTDFVRLRV